MRIPNALYRLYYVVTGRCLLCRDSGWVKRWGYWSLSSKACPACSPPAEGYRIGGVIHV